MGNTKNTRRINTDPTVSGIRDLIPGAATQVGSCRFCGSKVQTISGSRLTFWVATWVETFLKAPTLIKRFMSKSMHGTVTRVSAGSLTRRPQLSVFTEWNLESQLTDTSWVWTKHPYTIKRVSKDFCWRSSWVQCYVSEQIRCTSVTPISYWSACCLIHP